MGVDVTLRQAFPDRLYPETVTGPTPIMNNRKGRADPIAELEDAVRYLFGRRKLIIPGMCRRTKVTYNTSKTWAFNLTREPYTQYVDVSVVYMPDGGTGTISCKSDTYGGGDSLDVETGPQASDMPYQVASLELEYGDGDDADAGEEEVTVTVAHDDGADNDFIVYFIGFEPVPMETIEVNP